MKLVTPPEYIRQAAALVRKAEKRVFLIAMVIADHPATNDLMVALKEAAERGVSVTVAADVFTYGEVSGSFLPIRYYSSGAKTSTLMAKSLKSAGVHFHWLGRGRMTLFSGRTHSKWCVVDDTCFVFGGVNVFQGGIENVDYMFKVTSPQLADRLAHEQGRIQKAERNATNFPSSTFELDDQFVLFDGGIIARSVIYARACELAREAESILYVSQYCPTGKLAGILRTKKAKLYFNKPANADFFNGALIRISMLTSGFKTRYRKKNYLHAKFIIFTMPDGSKRAITGSHNFAYTGVLLGTREVALETTDRHVIDQLEQFYKTQII